MPAPESQLPDDAPTGTRAKIYERPSTMAVATRPLSLILVALLALVVGSLAYYKYAV